MPDHARRFSRTGKASKWGRTGRPAADPGFLDDANQRFLGGSARLRKRRKVRALPHVRNPQAERAEPRLERAIAIAVVVIQPLRAASVATGPDQPFDIGFYQDLQQRLGDGSRDQQRQVLRQPKLSLSHRQSGPARSSGTDRHRAVLLTLLQCLQVGRLLNPVQFETRSPEHCRWERLPRMVPLARETELRFPNWTRFSPESGASPRFDWAYDQPAMHRETTP